MILISTNSSLPSTSNYLLLFLVMTLRHSVIAVSFSICLKSSFSDPTYSQFLSFLRAQIEVFLFEILLKNTKKKGLRFYWHYTNNSKNSLRIGVVSFFSIVENIAGYLVSNYNALFLKASKSLKPILEFTMLLSLTKYIAY